MRYEIGLLFYLHIKCVPDVRENRRSFTETSLPLEKETKLVVFYVEVEKDPVIEDRQVHKMKVFTHYTKNNKGRKRFVDISFPSKWEGIQSKHMGNPMYETVTAVGFEYIGEDLFIKTISDKNEESYTNTICFLDIYKLCRNSSIG